MSHPGAISIFDHFKGVVLQGSFNKFLWKQLTFHKYYLKKINNKYWFIDLKLKINNYPLIVNKTQYFL